MKFFRNQMPIFISIAVLAIPAHGFILPSIHEEDVDVTILRPLNYEVQNIALPHIAFSVSTSAPTLINVSVQDLSGTITLKNRKFNIDERTQDLTFELTDEIRAWRGGWLKLKIMSGSITREVVFARGFVFLTAGQSNSANSECDICGTAPVSTNRVSFLSDSSIGPDFYPPNPYPEFGTIGFLNNVTRAPIATGLYQNVWYPVGRRIAQNFGVPVGFIAVGVGSTSVSSWNQAEYLYKRLLYAAPFSLTAVLWHQGETDAVNGMSTNDYKNHLNAIITRTRAEQPEGFGYMVPWLVSKASTGCGAPAANSAQIAAAQQQVINLGTAQKIYPGPDTDAITHTCHFTTPFQFNQYTDAWYNKLVSSGLLTIP